MLNHKQKLKLARRLRNDKEARDRTPVFQTEEWDKHKKVIQNKKKRKSSSIWHQSIWHKVETPQAKIR